MKRARARAFTLLEAVLAITILTSVMVVTLSMRADSMKRTAELSQIHRSDREIISLFHLLRSGMLTDPYRDEEHDSTIWEGEHVGRPYRIVRELIVVPNPDSGEVQTQVAERIGMYRYTIEYGDVQREFLWHR